jgi:hypothetical protein
VIKCVENIRIWVAKDRKEWCKRRGSSNKLQEKDKRKIASHMQVCPDSYT